MPLVHIEVVGSHRTNDEQSVVAMLAKCLQESQQLSGTHARGRRQELFELIDRQQDCRSVDTTSKGKFPRGVRKSPRCSGGVLSGEAISERYAVWHLGTR